MELDLRAGAPVFVLGGNNFRLVYFVDAVDNNVGVCYNLYTNY